MTQFLNFLGIHVGDQNVVSFVSRPCLVWNQGLAISRLAATNRSTQQNAPFLRLHLRVLASAPCGISLISICNAD